MLADSAYGDDGDFRAGLDDERLGYVVSVSPRTTVYETETEFAVPAQPPARGRPRKRGARRPAPTSVGALAAALPSGAWQTLVFGESPAGITRRVVSPACASSLPARSAACGARPAANGS